jgi:hypothetical protein
MAQLQEPEKVVKLGRLFFACFADLDDEHGHVSAVDDTRLRHISLSRSQAKK